MSVSGKSTFSSSDFKFLLTFVAGMGAFWLSGHLPQYLPLQQLTTNRPTLVMIGLVLALAIYSLSMFIWSWLVLGRSRDLKPPLMATVAAFALALATSLTLTYTTIGAPKDKNGLVILVFVLYLLYGLYFVIGWLAAKQLAKKRG
jgi:hypothetical protein